MYLLFYWPVRRWMVKANSERCSSCGFNISRDTKPGLKHIKEGLSAAHPPCRCHLLCTSARCWASAWAPPFYTRSPQNRPRSWLSACLAPRPSEELGRKKGKEQSDEEKTVRISHCIVCLQLICMNIQWSVKCQQECVMSADKLQARACEMWSRYLKVQLCTCQNELYFCFAAKDTWVISKAFLSNNLEPVRVNDMRAFILKRL